MVETRGNLKPATITTVEAISGEKVTINCMFNPENYTVGKVNTYGPTAGNSEKKTRIPLKPVFSQYGRRTLELSTLYFDAYETGGDVEGISEDLWKLMSPIDRNADPTSDSFTPPEVTFSWSGFSFKAFIESLSIKYTLFDKDGKPVRSEVTIKFIESESKDKPNANQNPTSGDSPVQEIRQVIYGDRLDLIAAEVYGDATKWRVIAEYNNIHNPKTLRPGQSIAIPPLQ